MEPKKVGKKSGYRTKFWTLHKIAIGQKKLCFSGISVI